MNQLLQAYQDNEIKLKKEHENKIETSFSYLMSMLTDQYSIITSNFNIQYIKIEKDKKVGVNGFVTLNDIDVPIFIYNYLNTREIHFESPASTTFKFPDAMLGLTQEHKDENLKIYFGAKLFKMQEALNNIIDIVINSERANINDKIDLIEKYNLYSNEKFKKLYDALTEQREEIRKNNEIKSNNAIKEEKERRMLIEIGQQENEIYKKIIEKIAKNITDKYAKRIGHVYKIKYIPNIFKNISINNEEDFDLNMLSDSVITLEENIEENKFYTTIYNHRFIEKKILNCTIFEKEIIPIEEHYYVYVNINSFRILINPIYYNEAIKEIETYEIPDPFTWENFWKKHKK